MQGLQLRPDPHHVEPGQSPLHLADRRLESMLQRTRLRQNLQEMFLARSCVGLGFRIIFGRFFLNPVSLNRGREEVLTLRQTHSQVPSLIAHEICRDLSSDEVFAAGSGFELDLPATIVRTICILAKSQKGRLLPAPVLSIDPPSKPAQSR